MLLHLFTIPWPLYILFFVAGGYLLRCEVAWAYAATVVPSPRYRSDTVRIGSILQFSRGEFVT